MKSESGQVTIDYIAGIGIFLLAVIFVFQFTYGLFVPFQSGSDKATLAADRAGTVLVERMLHADKASELNVIDQGKLYYFKTRLGYSNQTNYNAALREIGIFSNESVFDMNVTVAYLNGTIMKNGTSFPLVSGPALPETTDIGQTNRLVLIVNSSTGYNETAIISVRVW
ncbi:Uncharacterised protein [uncultured archaeon]|nr:Uncharacterised protein [uncultured archaeon]